MFGAFQTFGKLGAIGKAISAAWSPLALWPDGIDSPGMWIDPSLLTASFNDSAGTTPVSTPGTVADSANPVGLALDIRGGLAAGAVVFTENFASAGLWSLGTGATISGGSLNLSSTPNQTGAFLLNPPGMSAGKYYEITFEITSISSGAVSVSYGYSPGLSNPKTSAGIYTVQCFSADTYIRVYAVGTTTTAVIDNISIREIPGNHMLQATSAARPLESAYDGQTLGPGNTYDATGYPVFQLYDGVDDGMATASFAAGTLINGMDCMIAVRRDSGANCVAGLYNGIADATKFFGMAESASGSGCVGSGAGTPTVWVDNAQLTGGTAVTRGTLHTALTVGDYHILEFRGLDLSTWTAAGFGLYTSYVFPGARGDIMLFPSTASTEDKDAARQYLADYYGVTLP